MGELKVLMLYYIRDSSVLFISKQHIKILLACIEPHTLLLSLALYDQLRSVPTTVCKQLELKLQIYRVPIVITSYPSILYFTLIYTAINKIKSPIIPIVKFLSTIPYMIQIEDINIKAIICLMVQIIQSFTSWTIIIHILSYIKPIVVYILDIV